MNKTVYIDGTEMTVLDYRLEKRVNDSDRLNIELTGKNFVFGNTPHSFEFGNETWFVTAMSIQSGTSGVMTQTIEAVNKKMSMNPKPRIPPVAPPPVDLHEECVPIADYRSVKALAMKLLELQGDMSIDIKTEELEYLSRWSILQEETNSVETRFIGVPPEVSIKLK